MALAMFSHPNLSVNENSQMKLLTRYSLVSIALMIAIFIASAAVLYRFTEIILTREMVADLNGVKTKLENYVNEFHKFPEGFPLDEEELFYMVTDKPFPEQSQLTTMYSQREKKMHNFMKIDFPIMLDHVWYKVTIAKPLEGMHHLSDALITISILTIFIIIFLEIILNNYLLKRLWRPFYKAIEIMRGFRLGESNSLDFPKTSISEFSFMNSSLQFATNKARQDYFVLKEFTENASHEMQTPLSIIRSKLDMIIQEKEFSQKQSELIREAYRSVKKLTTLNRSLLLLAKIENQQFDNKIALDLKNKVEEKIEQFRELWQHNEIAVVSKLENSKALHIDPELLDILLNNLFSNASNHNIPHGYIGITLKPDQFIICNTGDPEPLNEQRLFTRFYKTSINSNQNGLGLSIIKQISKVSGLSIHYSFMDHKHSFTLGW
jgi:signal transduction histidine kinase